MATADLVELRKTLIAQYSGWLRDIDEKCRVTATIAAFLGAAAATLFAQHPSVATLSGLIVTFALALFSLVFAIRAYTSRIVSGAAATSPIKLSWRQWISYLLNCPTKWKHVPGDPIDKHFVLRAQAEDVQAIAHEQFFIDAYGTTNPERIFNLRLFEVRAANYSKAYGERAAARLLVATIAVFVVTLICGFSSGDWDASPRYSERQLSMIRAELAALRKSVDEASGTIVRTASMLERETATKVPPANCGRCKQKP